MHASRMTPSIEVTIGRETRLYHAFITTAPPRFDAPATVTLHTGPLSDVSGMAADPISFDDAQSLGTARARGRHRAGLAARPISRTGLSLRVRRSRARRTEHAAALAVEPDRFARDGSRTRKRIAANEHQARPTAAGPLSRRDIMNIEVKILRNEHGKPAGKLADAEIHFIAGELDGLKLVGFTIWRRREGNGRSVTSRRASSSSTATSATSSCFAPSAIRTTDHA